MSDTTPATDDEYLAAARSGLIDDRPPDDLLDEDFAPVVTNGKVSSHIFGTAPDIPTAGPDDEVASTSTTDPAEPDTLRIEDVAVVAARVDAKPPRKYLARPIIISGSHGGFAAEDTSGKSWASMDLAVNTAAGGAWLGEYPIDSAGPVLMFVGEEDEDEWIRRGRAVAEHYGYDFDALPIRLCQRVPKFTNEAHVNAVRWELDQHPTQLVVIDPLYLGFAGVQTGQLAEVGDALGHIQRACRDHGATLWLTHHWNKTGHGTGRERASGAGFKEWARTIASVAVKSRATDGSASVVTLDWEFVGNSIVDSKLRTRRKVYADDPDDLGSQLHYELEILTFDEDEDPDGLSPAQRRTLNAVFVASEETGSASAKSTQAATKDDGTDMPPLKLSTVQHALPELFALDLVDRDEPGPGKPVSWWPTRGPNE